MTIRFAISAPATRLNPIAICLTLPSGGPAVIPLEAFATLGLANDDEYEALVVSPSDCWLVHQDHTGWLVRMWGIRTGLSEIVIRESLLVTVLELGRDENVQLINSLRTKRLPPKAGRFRGLLASCPHGLTLIDFETSRHKAYVELGKSCDPSSAAVKFDAAARCWALTIDSDHLGKFTVPFPEQINATLAQAFDESLRPLGDSGEFRSFGDGANELWI